jgi:hypothetical protein
VWSGFGDASWCVLWLGPRCGGVVAQGVVVSLRACDGEAQEHDARMQAAARYLSHRLTLSKCLHHPSAAVIASTCAAISGSSGGSEAARKQHAPQFLMHTQLLEQRAHKV